MRGPRTRNERKQQLPNYLNEDQLLQELQQQAQQKLQQKQFEDLHEKEDLLKHMQNYQMGGDEDNRELEKFLQNKICELKKENEKIGSDNQEIYTQLQSHPQNNDLLAAKQQQWNEQQQYQQNFLFKGDQQKTQSEIEREKRLQLRQEERQRRLLGIQASVYDTTQAKKEPIKFNQQAQQEINYESPLPQVKQSIKSNSSNIQQILQGSTPVSNVGNQDILSNFIPSEQEKPQQQFLKMDQNQQKQKSTNTISNKDKQLKYKQELDQQIAQKRIRIQSAHPSYQEQPVTETAQSTRARIGVLPNSLQVQDDELKKLEELEKKRKYADELKKQMQEKQNPNNQHHNNNSISYHSNPQNSIQQQQQQQQKQYYQEPSLRENNPNYSNGAAAANYIPSSNPITDTNNTDKEKIVQQEKKRQYREELLQQMQEQSQKNDNKKRNITSARLHTQQSVPIQPTNESDIPLQGYQQQQQQFPQSPAPLPPKNQKICKKITKQYEDEDQVRQKQIQQQEYQEYLRKQIEEQTRKKEQEKKKLKEEDERVEIQLQQQRQQIHGQLEVQKEEDQNQQSKISRRKRVDNQLINQNLETNEQIAIKEQKKQLQLNNEFIQESQLYPQQQQPQYQQLDLQTQNSLPSQQQSATPKYIQPTENYSGFVSQNPGAGPQQYPQQQMYNQQMLPQNQQIQSPQIMEQQQFFQGQYMNQFQQPGQQFYQNQYLSQQQFQQPFQNPATAQPQITQNQFNQQQQQTQFTQQQFWPNQTQDQFQSFNNQLAQQQVNLELKMQKDAMNGLQNQMQQLVDMYKNQITEVISQKGTTDQQIIQLKQAMEEKLNNPYPLSEMNSFVGLNTQQIWQLQQQQQQQQIQEQPQNDKKYWSNQQQQQSQLQQQQQQQQFAQQLLSVPMQTPFKNNPSGLLKQSLLPSSSDYVQPETHIMEQSFQKDLLLFEKLNKNKESFAKQFEELQQKEQFLHKQINENEEFLRKSVAQTQIQSQKQQVEASNESLTIPRDIDQKLSKVVNADYSYFDQKRKQKKTEKQFEQMKEALLSEQSEENIDQSFEAANLSEIKKQEHEVKLGVAQFSNEQNSLVLQDEEGADQQNIQRFIESQVNEGNEYGDDDEINERELDVWDKKLLEEFEQAKVSGQPLINEELKAKLDKLSVHGSAEKEQQKQQIPEIKKNYGKPKTYDIFGMIEKQNSHMLTRNKEKQEQILTRLDKFIEEALIEVGDDYQQDQIEKSDQESENEEQEQEVVDTQELYEQVQDLDLRNKLSFKEALKNQESQRYYDDEDN